MTEKLHNDEQFVKFPVGLMEAVMQYKFTAGEYKVVLAVIRETYGWKKPRYVSKYGIVKMTGLSKRSAIDIVRILISSNVLVEKGHGARGAVYLGLRAPSAWKPRVKPSSRVKLTSQVNTASQVNLPTLERVNLTSPERVNFSKFSRVNTASPERVKLTSLEDRYTTDSGSKTDKRYICERPSGDLPSAGEDELDFVPYGEEEGMTEEEEAAVRESIRKWKEEQDATEKDL